MFPFYPYLLYGLNCVYIMFGRMGKHFVILTSKPSFIVYSVMKMALVAFISYHQHIVSMRSSSVVIKSKLVGQFVNHKIQLFTKPCHVAFAKILSVLVYGMPFLKKKYRTHRSPCKQVTMFCVPARYLHFHKNSLAFSVTLPCGKAQDRVPHSQKTLCVCLLSEPDALVKVSREVLYCL